MKTLGVITVVIIAFILLGVLALAIKCALNFWFNSIDPYLQDKSNETMANTAASDSMHSDNRLGGKNAR